MLRVRGLTKTIGATSVLDGVELELARGESVGVTAADGTGLSTLLQILGTLLPPCAGTIEVDGVDAVVHLHGARRQLTYCGETPLLGHGLSVGEYLRFRLSARRGTGGSRATTDEMLARTGLAKDAAVDSLSAGMRLGLSLAGALAGQPGLLLLDLPLPALLPLWSALNFVQGIAIGIPWLVFVTAVHASHIGRFSLYAGGDYMWMFQRWAYRIYLQGYWLQGG